MDRLGEGLDNVAFQSDGMVVRIRRADPGSVAREAALLRLMATVSPLPVPVPAEVDPRRGLMSYRKLPGVPLLHLPPPRPAPRAVGAVLGRFLAALHAVPVEQVAGLVPADDTTPAQWLAEAAGTWPAVAAHLPASLLPGEAPAPAPRAVFSHMDLGIEHVLIDPETGAVTGIIDWTDAAIGDPAHDLGLILRDLGPVALDVALDAVLDAALRARCAQVRRGSAHLGATGPPAPGLQDPGLRERAVFYARCKLIEDLAYGLTHDRPAYVHNSITAATRHF